MTRKAIRIVNKPEPSIRDKALLDWLDANTKVLPAHNGALESVYFSLMSRGRKTAREMIEMAIKTGKEKPK